jgi:thioesterase domain-containing protein
MLLPLQKSGNKPPLFFVHGQRGIALTVGSRFARMLGSEQPFYVIKANGMDGRRPILEDVREMVAVYLREIRGTRSTGLLRIGGMCRGGLIAIEIGRALQAEGVETGPVILVDPPVMPIGYEKRTGAINASPQVMERVYQELRGRLLDRTSNPDAYDDLPFDPRDPEQLRLAVTVGVSTMLAFAKYVPHPFSGSTEVIISEHRALAFLHPQMPWSKLLSGPRLVHVVPWSHKELFGAGRKTVARLMRSMLEEDLASASLAERQSQSTPYPMSEARL